MDVSQGATPIADGGSYSFGNVNVGSSSTATFTIVNAIGSTANLTITTPITVTGTGFSCTSQPASSVVSNGGSTQFNIRFAPVGPAGAKTGSVSISNTDGNENPYDISLSGTAVCPGTASITSQTNVTCLGGSDGALTVTQSGGTANFDYVWSNASSTLGSGLNTNSISGLTAGFYSVTVTDALGCVANASTTVTQPSEYNWIGGSSADWNDAANWCGGVPPSGADVVIGSGASSYPELEQDATVGDLTVDNGADFAIRPGQSLTISGNLINNGTFTVMSDATGIGSLITDGSISGSGSFHAQQYLTGSGVGTPDGVFYYVSSPVVGATAATYDLASGNKLWSADETTQDYAQIMNEATGLNAGEGYVARMGVTGVVTLDGSSFNTGNVNLNSLTRTGAGINAGYNLMGNPYPSSVSWDAATKGNLEDDIWFRTHTDLLQMNFDVYNAVSTIGTDNNRFNVDVTGVIPPGQAFWVRVLDGETNGSLGFTDGMRSHGAQTGLYKQEAEEGTVRMRLTGATGSDVTIVHFTPDAQDGYDAYDSHKMFGAITLPQVHTIAGDRPVAINGLFSTETTPTVDLSLRIPQTGDYTLTAHSITLNGQVWLEDRLLTLFQDLNQYPTYSFNAASGDLPARFALHFGTLVTGVEEGGITKNSRVYTTNGNEVNLVLPENTGSAMLEVLDMAGRSIHTSTTGADRTVIGLNVNAGIYLVRVTTQHGVDAHRVVLQ